MNIIENTNNKYKKETLHSDEIAFINEFLNNIKDVDSIEGVLLKSIYKEEWYRYETFDYCHIEIIVATKKDPIDSENIFRLVNELRYNMRKNRHMPINSFEFTIYKTDDFIKDSFAKQLYETDLVSSYIIFDRNNYFTSLQESLKSRRMPYSDSAIIDNIDKLNICKKRVLLKKGEQSENK